MPIIIVKRPGKFSVGEQTAQMRGLLAALGIKPRSLHATVRGGMVHYHIDLSSEEDAGCFRAKLDAEQIVFE
jgi:hypothetical protein